VTWVAAGAIIGGWVVMGVVARGQQLHGDLRGCMFGVFKRRAALR
jgi:hypothetical protein